MAKSLLSCHRLANRVTPFTISRDQAHPSIDREVRSTAEPPPSSLLQLANKANPFVVARDQSLCVRRSQEVHMAKSSPPPLLWLANRAAPFHRRSRHNSPVTKSRAMATFLSLPPCFLLCLTASLASWVAKGSNLAMPPAESGARGFGGGDSQA